MSDGPPLRLFEAVGVEIEHMIVDRERLDVLSVCDQVIAAETGRITTDAEFDDVSWSNELALHVIELKTSGPVRALAGLAERFAHHVGRINAHLAALGGRLMPTAMHPWMDPAREAGLWPHDYGEVYAAFDRLFGCRSHGWANLQSIHINLPFADDGEFARLHAAVRLLLPILPALAASSPFVQGRASGLLDTRLEHYRSHCAAIPSLVGRVIPEPVFTAGAYRERILDPIYRDLKPHDSGGLLRHEWSNARGAIARFDRNTIEIRLLDMQECPAADVAVVAVVVGAIRLLVEQTWAELSRQQTWPVEMLATILDHVTREGEQAIVDDEDYLRMFGMLPDPACWAGDIWHHLIETIRSRWPDELACCAPQVDRLLSGGPLARRILKAAGSDPSRETLAEVYRLLCDHLAGNRMFDP